MNTTTHPKTQLALKAALAAVILVLIVLCVFLVRQYQHIQRLDYISQQRSLFISIHGSGPLTAADASSTQEWMTFDYIDKAFTLPPQYLQTALAITDSRYPRMTITRYASVAGLSQPEALLKVQDAIRAFSTSTAKQ